MKKLLAALLAAVLFLGAASRAVSGEAAYTDREVPLISADRGGGVITLRFYRDRPNVPYIGFRAFMDFAGSDPVTFERAGDGTAVFTSVRGAVAEVDAERGTMYVENWPMFRDPPPPYEGRAVGLKDSDCGFVRVKDVVYEGVPAPLSLDFAEYGLKLYAGEDDVYFPVTLISSMMTDVATWNMTWDGERIRYGRFGTDISGDRTESPAVRDALAGGVRPADIAAEARGELLFMLDNFYGHPGRAGLDAEMAEKGLERALIDAGAGSLAEGLGSTAFPEYLASLLDLFFGCLDDGHTAPTVAVEVFNALLDGRYPKTAAAVIPAVRPTVLVSSSVRRSLLLQTLPAARRAVWGDEGYREYGSTAFIRLDSFMPDEAGWAAYYAGAGDMPSDGAGNTVRGLKRAAENPGIKNVIFDLSCNVGGSSDVLAFIVGLTTGGDRLYGLDKVTGQKLTVRYGIDADLDGVFDEKDGPARFDRFNYGVLTTRLTFSCGNLFPFMMREGGAVLLGESSGGGSCCIQLCSMPDGMDYVMSSSRWQLTDSGGVPVEGGCPVDIPLPVKGFAAPGAGYGPGDYALFFDDAGLDRMMNEWFADGAADAA